jgi:hypothetical protein
VLVPHSFRCSKTNSGRVESLREQDPDPPLGVTKPNPTDRFSLALNLPAQSGRSGFGDSWGWLKLRLRV